MKQYQTDTDGFWGHIGFGADRSATWFSCLLYSHSVFNPTQFQVACKCRFGRRALLALELGLGGAEPPDEAFVTAAFLRWGEDCGVHLDGEFAFALRGGEGSLFLCVDHTASERIFYFEGSQGVSFASDVARLLQMEGVPREPHFRTIATQATPHLYGASNGETFHAHVLTVPPGTWVKFSPTGKKTAGRYWAPKATPETITKNEDEAFADLRLRLFEAVDNRLQCSKNPAILLSGGLDSSAIAAIAARSALRRSTPISAFTAVVPDRWGKEFSDERNFALEFAPNPGIQIELVEAGERGPFDSIETPEAFANTFSSDCLHYQTDALTEAAALSGVDLLMHGSGGELGVTYHGSGCLSEWLIRFQWIRLARELAAFHGTTGRTPFRALGSQILDVCAPMRGLREFPYFTEGFRQLFCPEPIFGTRSPFQRQRNLHMAFARLTGARMGQRARKNRIPLSSPLLDRRVLEWCLSAPAKLKWRNGYNRYPVRGALQDLLPPKILWRTTKLGFAPDYSRRYNNQLGKVKAFLEDIRPGDPVREIVNVEKLQSSLRPLKPTPRGFGIEHDIPRAVYLICFLRQFSGLR